MNGVIINYEFFSTPYTRIVDNRVYDRRILDIAETAAKKEDGISIRDVKLIFSGLDTNTFTLQRHLETATLKYVREKFKFTVSGEKLFDSEMEQRREKESEFINVYGMEFDKKKLIQKAQERAQAKTKKDDPMLELYRLLKTK